MEHVVQFAVSIRSDVTRATNLKQLFHKLVYEFRGIDLTEQKRR